MQEQRPPLAGAGQSGRDEVPVKARGGVQGLTAWLPGGKSSGKPGSQPSRLQNGAAKPPVLESSN